jgi:hypothetical protein
MNKQTKTQIQEPLTKEQMKAQIEEFRKRNSMLEEQNQKLRAQVQTRPKDALVFGCMVTFQKQTHLDMEGTSLGGVEIPPESVHMYFSSKHDVRISSNGNAQHYVCGWVDTSKLKLPQPGEKKKKESQTLKEIIGV